MVWIVSDELLDSPRTVGGISGLIRFFAKNWNVMGYELPISNHCYFVAARRFDVVFIFVVINPLII